jgi:hypothetical protein
MLPISIERDTKGVYMVPAFELKSGSKGNDALLPSDWSGVMQGLQQVHCNPSFYNRISLTSSAGAASADIERYLC